MSLRSDLQLVAEMVAPGSRVLDIGCGEGDLLADLAARRQVDGRGLEISPAGVNACVAKGLSVIQGDANTDLYYYPDDSFDYVILTQTLQATLQPRAILQELVRIGRHAIVSFPNFGHWRVRLALLLNGRMPRTEKMPYPWWETPNIHLCTIADFAELAGALGLRVERAVILDGTGRPVSAAPASRRANWIGETAVFLLKRPDGAG